MTATPIDTLTPHQVDAAENFDDGYRAGWTAAEPTIQARDEWIARRITALLLQHGYNQELAESVARTQPYAERGIPRQVAS